MVQKNRRRVNYLLCVPVKHLTFEEQFSAGTWILFNMSVRSLRQNFNWSGLLEVGGAEK